MSLNNIDSLLQTIATDEPAGTMYNEPSESAAEEHEPEVRDITSQPRTDEPEAEAEAEEPKAVSETETEDDEYGTPVAKKERVYTESEVQQMMRDRNARGEFARQEAQRQQQKAQQQPQHQQVEGNEDWEAQLESFVEQTLSKREQKLQEQQWQQQEQQAQANFEIKFNTGAAKYADFESVVMNKALTPQMVIATRGMSDPAAFIYAAAKTQAAELERISKISDRYVQAVEIGKLDERMKKSRASTSSAPKPIAGVKGDVLSKVKPTNIDDILRSEDAKRLKNRR